MENIPSELRYTKNHEWLRLEDDGTVRVGITQHAQHLLGDMVFVDLPDMETEVSAGHECAVVESVKAASDVYSPVSGEVIAVNEELLDSPDLVNSDPYGNGWLFAIRPSSEAELEELLDQEDYAAIVEEES